jgi:DNA-binding transcriptional MocR family regulator
MSRKYKDKGKIAGHFVPMLIDTMKAAAWRAMSPAARVLYVALKSRYSFELKNNGRLYLSVRQAATEIGLDKKTVARAFRELQYYGFIVMINPVALALKAGAKLHTGDSPNLVTWAIRQPVNSCAGMVRNSTSSNRQHTTSAKSAV